MPTKERRLKEIGRIRKDKRNYGPEISREEMLEKENFRLKELLNEIRPVPAHEQDRMPTQKTLIAFESGHYKAFTGSWLGDSVWGHHRTIQGKTIHINKDKVEYIETE